MRRSFHEIRVISHLTRNVYVWRFGVVVQVVDCLRNGLVIVVKCLKCQCFLYIPSKLVTLTDEDLSEAEVRRSEYAVAPRAGGVYFCLETHQAL
jgi:hypothetical protein